MTIHTMPSSIYATEEAANRHGYLLLNPILKESLKAEYGHMAPLGDDFAEACDLAEDRYAITSPVGYVLAFDPASDQFVAFAAVSDIKMIHTSELAVFDAIVDEATENGDDVHAVDGVARINNGFQTTVVVLSLGEE